MALFSRESTALDRELGAALAAAALQDVSTCRGTRTNQEPVGLGTLTDLRLVGALGCHVVAIVPYY